MRRVETIGNRVTLYLGDCREVLPHIGKVDAVVTDPPYGVEFKGKVNKDMKHSDGYAGKIGDDSTFIATVVIPAINDALAKCDRAAVFPGCRQMWKYPEPEDIGDFFVQFGGGVTRWGFSSVNPILYYGKDPFLQRGMGSRPNSWLVAEVAEKNGHPCPKPIGWMLKIVNRVSFPDDLILDPFMGSGTTGVAAVRLGRKFIGIEVEPKYFEIARRRIEEETRQQDFFVEKPKPAEQLKLLGSEKG